MHLESYDLNPLRNLLENGTEFIIDRLYYYVNEIGYAKYTSTLKEAWRMSIVGLSEPLIKNLKRTSDIPVFGPDDDFSSDPIASFGVLEAQRHRSRGITLEMFLGLMKYYRQSFIDLIISAGFKTGYEEYCRLYVNHYFDLTELGFCSEWIKDPLDPLIKELQKSNRRMTNEKNKYLTMFESVPNPVLFINKDKTLENLNNKAAILFKKLKTPGAIYYKEDKKEKTPDWLVRELEEFILSKASEFMLEKEFMTSEGQKVFNIEFKKMLDISNKYEGTIVILSDISDLKSIQKQLKEQNKELESITRLKSEFLKRTSHELKTPLISIKGFQQLLLEIHQDKLDIDMILLLEEIGDGCFRLEKIIKNLLKGAELESSKVELTKTKEDFSFLIKYCIKDLRGLADSRRHSIYLDLDDKIQINIDKEQIYDVLTNLLSNSFKYSQPGGNIHIHTEFDGDKVILSVKDDGIGFTEEEAERIFKMFGKLERYGQGLDLGIDGSGLGLYISKKIVELHGGEIWVESEGHNKGSTFYFSLPM